MLRSNILLSLNKILLDIIKYNKLKFNFKLFKFLEWYQVLKTLYRAYLVFPFFLSFVNKKNITQNKGWVMSDFKERLSSIGYLQSLFSFGFYIFFKLIKHYSKKKITKTTVRVILGSLGRLSSLGSL